MRSLRSFIHSTLRKEEMEALNLARERLHIPIDEIKNIQEFKVRKLIDYAKNNSSYYKSVLKNVSYENLNDLKKLPFLTKEIIKNEYDGIICKSDFAYLKKDSTSGSTSQATYFGTDLRSFNTKRARLDRANEMNGKYKYLDKILVFWGAERDLLNKWDIRKFYNHHIKHARVISTYHMTKEDIKKNLNFINKWKPCLVVGYPSALNFMADFISHNPGILKHHPKAIISAGEMLYETQRENIETQFCSEVFNRYGSREFTQIACECSSHSGLHYDAEDLIIEVVDDQGNPCPPEVIGHLVITDLNNFVFPMIRYQVGDMGSLATYADCACGSTLPKLKEIQGRSFDVIRGINGNSVSGSFWTLAFRHKIEGVTRFQVRQKVLDEIEIKIQVGKDFDSQQENKIKEIVREKLGEETKVKISMADQFEYSPTGKFKWVVSNL